MWRDLASITHCPSCDSAWVQLSVTLIDAKYERLDFCSEGWEESASTLNYHKRSPSHIKGLATLQKGCGWLHLLWQPTRWWQWRPERWLPAVPRWDTEFHPAEGQQVTMPLSWAWHLDKCLYSWETHCHDRHLQGWWAGPWVWGTRHSVSSCSGLMWWQFPSVLVMARKEKLRLQEDEERGEQTHISPYSFC